MFEAVLAAAYLDGGMDAALTIVQKTLGKLISEAGEDILGMDSKSLLQEYLQMKAMQQPRYDVVSFSGPDHNRVFRVQVICGTEVLGEGEGKSKKAAEQDAAKNALAAIGASGKGKDELQEQER